MRLAHNAIAEINSQKPYSEGLPVVFNAAPAGLLGQHSNSVAECHALTALLIHRKLISNQEYNLNEVGREALPFSFFTWPYLQNERIDLSVALNL